MTASTLDSWCSERAPLPFAAREAVLAFAGTAGPLGFTADDLRAVEGVDVVNRGSILGALVGQGRLRVIGEERSRVRSSKARRVRRFVLAGGDSDDR